MLNVWQLKKLNVDSLNCFVTFEKFPYYSYFQFLFNEFGLKGSSSNMPLTQTTFANHKQHLPITNNEHAKKRKVTVDYEDNETYEPNKPVQELLE